MRSLLRGRTLGLLALASVLLVQVLSSGNANALSNRGPDLADLGAKAGDVVGYILVDEPSATVRTVKVPLYFTEKTSVKTVTIHDVNLCTDGLDTAPNSGGNYRDRNGSGYATSKQVSAYSVTGSATVFGVPSSSNTCYQATKTITIPNGSLKLDASLGLYTIDFSALMPSGVTNVQNHFYITLNRADGIVGYSNSADASRFGVAQEYKPNVYKKYSLPFAPDCTVSASKIVRASIYDDDNGTAAIQPKKFSMYMQEYTAAGVATSRVPLTVTATTKQNTGNNTWVAQSGNKKYTYVDFTVRPGYKYKFVLDSIYSVNLLQFQLPFDSIYFEKPCSTSVDRQSSISPTPVVQEGQQLTGKYSVINSGPVPGAVNYTAIAWRDDNDNNVPDPGETRFLNDAKTANVPAKSTVNLPDWTDTASLTKHGGKVCVGIQITAANAMTQIAHTDMDVHCTRIGKKPKVQVWGGDVRVRGQIETSTATIDNGTGPKLFGSWVEYGSLSVGTNVGFASGSGLNGGSTAPTTKDWNKLTFANTESQYGGYTLPPQLASLAGQFAGAASNSAPRGDMQMESGTYKTANLTISGGTVAQDAAGKGKSIIIVASGTVTINGDINYKGPGGADGFTSPGQIPQVVIIANKINIAGNVGQVNAWLLTTGTNGSVNTCADRAVTDKLNSTVCNNKLTVNGAVATQHLYLRRTGGSDAAAAAGDPAETFNLRPDAYIWAYLRASQNGKAQTVYSTELPPRF